jgi:AcrR family transcriptional regulator
MAGLTRRAREKERHKQEILRAALRLFSAKGFYNVSMQNIADESGFGVGTLYNFFESKDALFDELTRDGSERIICEFSEILDRPVGSKEVLAAFIRQQPKLQEQYGELIKLHLSVFGVKGSRLSKASDDNMVHNVINPKLVRLIKKGINEGVFRNVDPEITARALGAVIEALVFETTDTFDRGAAESMFKKVEQLFLDGLLRSE